MEESSEKRRERLQAMRVEASSQSQPLSPSSSSSLGQNLSNPLINSADGGERTPQAPRFDYYTDPMAAFSGSKRRHLNSPPGTYSPPVRSASPVPYPSGGPRNFHVPDAQRQGFQFQTSQSPDQSVWRSPVQFQTPPSGHMRGAPTGYTPSSNSWVRSSGGSPGHDQNHWRSPIQFQSMLSGNIPPGSTPPICTPNPNSWGRSSRGSPVHGFAPNYSSRGHGLRSPEFRHSPYSNPGMGSECQSRGGHSPYSNPGMGFEYQSRGGHSPCSNPGRGFECQSRGSHNPHSNHGRGSGWQSRGGGSSPKPRQGGRGGNGSNRRWKCSKPNDPKHFYKAVMKDPWRKLKPVVRKVVASTSGSGAWLPKSIAAPKRAKVIESGSKSQMSLAESLALSLEEAMDDV